jgi:hypothetical protein
MKSRAVGVIAQRARQGRGIIPAGSVTPLLVTPPHVGIFRRGQDRIPTVRRGRKGGSHPQGPGQPEGASPTMPTPCDPPDPDVP